MPIKSAKIENVDMVFTLFEAFFSAIGLVICLMFFLVGVFVVLWWLYTNVFSEKITAKIVGIRAYKKDTTIEDGVEVKTKPYDMYSPLLSCKLPLGAVVSGRMASSQNWLPEKWEIGKTIKVTKTSDDGVFQGAAGFIPLIIGLMIIAITASVVYSININRYSLGIVAFFALNFIRKIITKLSFVKIKDFFANKKWREARLDNPLNKKLRKEEELEKNWHKLSSMEVAHIFAKQKQSFFKVGFLVAFIASAGMLGVAYKIGNKFLALYLEGKEFSEIVGVNPVAFAISSGLCIVAVLISTGTIAKAIRLSNKTVNNL